MSLKHGRIPILNTKFIDEEIVNYKNEIHQSSITNKTNGKREYIVIIII